MRLQLLIGSRDTGTRSWERVWQLTWKLLQDDRVRAVLSVLGVRLYISLCPVPPVADRSVKRDALVELYVRLTNDPELLLLQSHSATLGRTVCRRAKQDPPMLCHVQPPPWGPGTSEALALQYPCPYHWTCTFLTR